MDIKLVILLFLVGILFIIKGGDYFVDAASWMAEVSGIPKLIVGATVVSLATTLPEMMVSLMAAGENKVDMAIGNAVGSVTANIGLIMAIAVLFMPGVIKRSDYILKSALMLGAALLIVVGGFAGELRMPLSVALLAIFFLFLWENVSGAKKSLANVPGSGNPSKGDKPSGRTICINLVKFVVGTIGIVWGADLLVDNGSELARFIGISERIIGVTVIAVGTSLPELITTVTAITKKQSALSVGNILGANIIDLTLILPLSAFVSGKALPIARTSAMIDLPACLLVGFIAIVPAMAASRFRRWQGVVMLAVYIAYVILTCSLQ